MDPSLAGEPVKPIPTHGDACWGCGAKGALKLRFVDDGRVTRAQVPALGPELAHADTREVRDGIVLAIFEEAARAAAWTRLHAATVETDGKTEFFAKGVQPGITSVVEAWPGRRSGSGFYFYARLLQDGEERAHMETWLRGA